MLKAINPEAVKTVEINGAKFDIGVVPFQKFVELQAQLTGIGIDNLQKMPKEVYDIYLEYVRWGVKGHGDIEIDGKSVPFESDDNKIDGKVFKVASDDMLQLYVTNKIYIQLASEVMRHNKLTEDEEKN